MDNEKTVNQCGSCRWYDGIGDQCEAHPGKRRETQCSSWEPDGRGEKKVVIVRNTF